MDVSIIIVNYNTKDVLSDCLKSIYEKTTDLNFEIIVSDNGSVDGSIEMLRSNFPQVVLIENNANLGFGTANNRGLDLAKGKYVFYLNSDTILINNAIKILFDYFEENGEKDNIGALGGALFSPKMNYLGYGANFTSVNHKLKIAFIDFLRITKNSLLKTKKKYQYKTFTNINSEKKVPYRGKTDFIAGSALFVKNDSFARFDERFFMYCEEADLQLQMQRAGKIRYVLDTPQIIHLEGASSDSPLYKLKDPLQFYTSFSKLNQMVSTIILVKKNYNAPVRLFLIRLFTFLSMINPKIYPHSKKYIKKIWR
ncbi:glycosyltransferase family 2 protein [Treponema sp. C6A8]|uniref:glycosyltransferase family 2 protein n=1 Tax=Treponema sp. C6A8 TaxID=1410609 RepID=UPI0006873E95|nr:glycosyltransferase family 2 protein [Treponema sp. C6A8]